MTNLDALPPDPELAVEINDLPLFFAHCIALEADAVERYEELAGQMEAHNNPEVAALFQKMAQIEARHLAEIQERAAGRDLPSLEPWEYQWPDRESPEAVTHDSVHYLMTPWHAIQLAIEAEERARDFFARVSETTRDDEVRGLARNYAEEEGEHVALLEEWAADFDSPMEDWSEDPDRPQSV